MYKRIYKLCKALFWNKNLGKVPLEPIVPPNQKILEKLRGMNGPDWVPFTGGLCPVKTGTLVDVKFRNGLVVCQVPAGVSVKNEIYDASDFYWERDIVAYRVVL